MIISFSAMLISAANNDEDINWAPFALFALMETFIYVSLIAKLL